MTRIEPFTYDNLPEGIIKGFNLVLTRIEELEAKLHPQQKEDEVISRKEAGKLLGITLPTVTSWTKEGKLTAYRVGSRIFYKKQEVIDSLTKIRYKYGKI